MARNYFSQLALELVFPSFCALCQKAPEEPSPICLDCLEKIERIGSARCEICGKALGGEVRDRLCGDCITHKPAFDQARAWAKFQEPMVEIIHRFKYQHGFYFLEWMIQNLTEVFNQEFKEEKFDLIIPIPLHWRRLLDRGYNQALILAKPLSKKLKIKIAPSVLLRLKNTKSQVGLSPAQRRENLKKSFKVKRPGVVLGKKILLVDDVITTGTTIDEASKTLKKAGAERVCALALART